MQVHAATDVMQAAELGPLPPKGGMTADGPAGVFRQLLKDEHYPAIRELTERIVQGKRIEPQELLVLQVRVAEYSQRVELCSRCAESVLATARKLQSAQ